MGAGQTHVDTSLFGQGLDGLFSLGQQFDEFQTLRAGNRLADTGNVFVEVELGNGWFHDYNLTIIGLFVNIDALLEIFRGINHARRSLK